MCHSDEHLVTGDMVLDAEITEMMGWQQFPIVAGHEGAGEVVEVGPGVTNLAVGDHVVTSFVPSCGVCPSCSTGHQNLCDLGATLLSGRQQRRHRPATTPTTAPTSPPCAASARSPSTASMNKASVIKIDPDIPLDKAALVACGVTTGWGSATYAAEVQGRRDGRGRRHRRRRHERGAGRRAGRRPLRHRRRPGRVQAGAGADLRRHPRGRPASRRPPRCSASSRGAATPTRSSSPPAWPRAT